MSIPYLAKFNMVLCPAKVWLHYITSYKFLVNFQREKLAITAASTTALRHWSVKREPILTPDS